MRFEDALNIIFDRLMSGVMLFCKRGQLLYSNASVLRYNRLDLLPTDDEGHYSQLGNADLRDAIDAVLRGGMSMAATILIQSSRKPPLAASIIPARDIARAGPNDFACAVLLSPGHIPCSSTATLMGHAYQLTAAETRLLRLLLDGMTLDEAASALGVKRATVTTHLKGIFNKVHVQRQSDLVRVAWQMSPAAE